MCKSSVARTAAKEQEGRTDLWSKPLSVKRRASYTFLLTKGRQRERETISTERYHQLEIVQKGDKCEASFTRNANLLINTTERSK